jgi:hypothetical protein
MSKNRLAQFARFLPPSTQDQIDRFAADLGNRADEMSKEELAHFDKRLSDSFAVGFNYRDEANALVALAMRNGPIEELHAGKRSLLLEDKTLSRITDKEMKVMMIYASRMLAGLLRMRDSHAELYRRYVQSYGNTYCNSWEREP